MLPLTRFQRSSSLFHLRKAAYDFFENQNDSDHKSPVLSKAAFRRTYRLAVLKIIAREYIQGCSLSSFASIFGHVLFPFSGIDSGDGPFNLHKISRICVYNLVQISYFFIFEVATFFLRRKIGSAFPSLETYLRKDFYELFIKTFFDSESGMLTLSSEYPCSNVDSRYSFIVDDVVRINPFFFDELAILEHLPIIYIEYALEPLLPLWAHKDESKIAFMMAASLLKIIRACKHLGIPFLKNMFVQGVLVGGFVCDFVVLKPQFGTPTIVGDTTIIPFGFIFESNRFTNRFSLFCAPGDEVGDQVLHRSWGYIDDPYQLVFNGPQMTVENFSFRSDPDEQEDLISIQIRFEVIAEEEEIIDSVPPTSREIKELLNAQKVTAGMVVNETCLRVFDRVRQAAEHLAQTLVEALRNDPGTGPNTNDDDGLDFMENELNFTSSSRDNHSSRSPKPDSLTRSKDSEYKTPTKKSPSQLGTTTLESVAPSEINSVAVSSGDPRILEKYREPFIWDENGHMWIMVMKRRSEYELKVYSEEIIRKSHFIPEFRKYTLLSQKHVLLELEAVYPLSQFRSIAFPPHTKEPFVLVMARLFLNCIGALRDIHAAGFVHSDVSINNIGYNRRNGLWQIFDFNQSMPIEDSLITKRCAGTHHFMSEYSLESKLFRPLDDYIALTRSAYYSYGGITSSSHEYFRSIISEIRSAEDTRDADRWYVKAFKIFKNIYTEKRSIEGLNTDPAYVTTKKTIRNLL